MSKAEADAKHVEAEEEGDDDTGETHDHAADVAAMKEAEKKLLDKYGKLPSTKPKQTKQRKFFDSGEYETNKAKKGSGEPVGVGMPDPANIPHSVPGKVAEAKSHSSLASTVSSE